MIQRIQTVYLLLVLTALIILSVGKDVFTSVVTQENHFELVGHANVYGVQKDIQLWDEIADETQLLLAQNVNKEEVENDMKNIRTSSFPFYIFTIGLSMLTVLVILSYKNIERQRKLGRLLFVLILGMFVAASIFYYSFSSSILAGFETSEVHSYLEFGFYCIAVSVAFSFLAITGMTKDIKLIKSIDRIR